MIVLDTTFLIDQERDTRLAERAVAWVKEHRLAVAAQAAIEYAAGQPDPHRTMLALRAAYDVLPVDDEIMEVAAEVARRALGRGVFPGWPDIQIAATALVQGARVATRNVRHFEEMGVPVQPY